MSVLKIKKEDGTWEVISGGSANAGSVDIDLNGSNEGAANLINADTLGGRVAADYATQSFVTNKIAEAQLGGGESGNIDLSGYATKDDIAEITADNLGAIKTSQIVNDFTITEEGYVADARMLKALNDNKIEMDLVWQIADGASSIAESTVTLTSGNYTHFLVDFYGLNESRIVRAGTRLYCTYTIVDGQTVNSDLDYHTSVTISSRRLDFTTVNTTNTVTIESGRYTYYITGRTDWQPTALANGRCVPIKIWGIRGIS